MYRITDKSQAISAIQAMLSRIYSDSSIVRNGVYDSKTKDGVRKIQQGFGIKEDGVLDYLTTELIRKSYEESLVKSKVQAENTENIEFPVWIGDYGRSIEHINHLLLSVLGRYGIYTDLKPSKYFSNESAMATSAARKLFFLPEANFVDEIMYNRLLIEEKSHVNSEQNGDE